MGEEKCGEVWQESQGSGCSCIARGMKVSTLHLRHIVTQINPTILFSLAEIKVLTGGYEEFYLLGCNAM
jgi:hypothetical protein